LEEGDGLNPLDPGRDEPVQLLFEIGLEGVDRPEGDEAVSFSRPEEEVVHRPDVPRERREGQYYRFLNASPLHRVPEGGDGPKPRHPDPHPPLDGGDRFWRHLVGIYVGMKVNGHDRKTLPK